MVTITRRIIFTLCFYACASHSANNNAETDNPHIANLSSSKSQLSTDDSSAITSEDFTLKIATSTNLFPTQVKNGRCSDTKREGIAGKSRESLERLLICMALAKVGLNPKIEIVLAPNYRRAIMAVSTGTAHMTSETVWEKDAFSNDFYASSPIIEYGESKKGIYTLKGHPLLNSTNVLKDLSQSRGVSVLTWHVDLKTIDSLAQQTFSAVRYASVFNVLANQRADFTLLDFPNSKSLDIEVNGYVYQPVPNIKVSMLGSRHFIVSKANKDGKQLAKKLQHGLALLKKAMKSMKSIGALACITSKPKIGK